MASAAHRQTVGRVTTPLKSLSWKFASEALGPVPGAGAGGEKLLTAEVQVTSSDPNIHATPGRPLESFLESGLAMSPVGFGSVSIAPEPSRVVWARIDPRWDPLQVEFTFKLPNAPENVSGDFKQSIDFGSVAVPANLGERTQPGIVKTTTNGTRISLNEIECLDVPTVSGIERRLVYTMAWQSSVGIPDLNTGIVPESAVDAGGNDLMPAEFLNPGDEERFRTTWGRNFLVSEVPASAGDVRLVVRVSERAPSRRQNQWFRKFHISVSQRDIRNAPPGPWTTVKAVDAAGVRATIESSLSNNDSVGKKQIAMRLWLEKPPTTPLPKRVGAVVEWSEWAVKSIGIKDHAGAVYKPTISPDFTYSTTGASSPNIHWKSNGAPASSGETAFDVTAPWLHADAGPSSVDLDVTIQAYRRAQYLLSFLKVPLPAPGETMTLNREVHDAHGRVAGKLRTVIFYTKDHPLSEELKALMPFGPGSPPEGIAFDVELKPLLVDVSGDEAIQLYYTPIVKTSPGAWPIAWTSNMSGTKNGLQQDLVKGVPWVVTMLPPGPKLRLVDLGIAIVQQVPIGQEERLQLNDVPVAPEELLRQI